MAPGAPWRSCEGSYAFLTDQLLPHEQEEDETVHPTLAAAIGNDEATAAFHGTQTRSTGSRASIESWWDMLPADGPEPEDLPDLRRVLYGLHAILQLHQSQEEELYASVSDPSPTRGTSPVSRPAQGAPGG